MMNKIRLWLIEKLANEDISVTERMRSKVYDYPASVHLSTVRDEIYIETPLGNMLINTNELTITTKYFLSKFKLIEKDAK